MGHKRDQVTSFNHSRPNRRPLAAMAAALSVALILAALTVAASASAGAVGESIASTQVLGPDSTLAFGADSTLGFAHGSRTQRQRPASPGDLDAGSNDGHGFVRDAGGFTTIDAPGASVTSVTGAGNGGRIVGAYRDARRKVHGFLRSKRGFRKIDFPGAKGTVVWKTSARGQMVGTYT
jgi:hypothetical protein